MDVLFVGLLYNPNYEKELIEKSTVGVSVASNIFQWNLIEGLAKQQSVNDISVLSSIPAGNYPNLNKNLYYKNNETSFNEICQKEIGFINFYVIKHAIRRNKLKKEIKRWMQKNQNKELCIIFYDLYEPFLKIIRWLDKFKGVKTMLIVPDLTGKYRNNTERGRLVDLVGKITSNNILKKASNADAHVFLTEQMRDLISSKKYVIVDGIIDENKATKQCSLSNKKIYMYAGALSHEYGIDILIDAFSDYKDSNCELWFCGKGQMEEAIINATKHDKRVRYFGFVDKARIVELENNITAYINPRYNSGLFTKYSFPSKNLEYLLAAKPVICHKLWGMSDEYDDIFFYLKSNTKEAYIQMFEYINSLSEKEILNIGLRCQNFVIEHNNKEKTSGKNREMHTGCFDETV